MRLKESFLIIILLNILIQSFVFAQGNSNEEQKEIGYWILDLEKEGGFDVGNAYQILDSIMLVAENELKSLKKEKYSKEEAIKILETIGNILDNFKFKISISRDTTSFSHSLNEKKSDCDVGSILYITIAQRRRSNYIQESYERLKA